MGTLKLKATMLLTFFLVFGVLFAFLSIVSLYFGFGAYGALFISLFFVTAQWYFSPKLIRWSTKMQPLQKGENAFLENAVEDLAREAGIPAPQIAIVPDPTPNAFVFGRTVKSSMLAVHQGLLNTLSKDEVKAVLAHEIGHLKHRDCQLMTVVSAIPLVAYMMWRSTFFTRRRSKGGGAMIAVGIASLLVYFLSQLLVLSLSRLREYYADAYSAKATGKPSDLGSALTKISLGLSRAEKTGNLRAFYIGDPITARREISAVANRSSQYDVNGDGVLDDAELQRALKEESASRGARLLELFSTHPRVFRRLDALKKIEGELAA
ncbi:MAG: M48 family metalloprotease [archaeon]